MTDYSLPAQSDNTPLEKLSPLLPLGIEKVCRQRLECLSNKGLTASIASKVLGFSLQALVENTFSVQGGEANG